MKNKQAPPLLGLEEAVAQAAKLAHMAKQIADFFRPYPRENAVASIAGHINQFWTAQMRRDFVDAVDARWVSLDPLVVEALPAIHKKPIKHN